MQVVSPARLEGFYYKQQQQQQDGSPKTDIEPVHNQTLYIPECTGLNAQVCALHTLARTGQISADTAERQINTYLLAARAASERKKQAVPLKWLVLPLTDAPHHTLMPDLGQIIHRVLARDPIPCALSAVVEQSIPRFRHTSRSISYQDSQPVLISLVMGLLLGLYHGSSVKKPGFWTRSILFSRIHSLLVSTPEEQTSFCKHNEEIVLLASMEYLARVLQMHMPVQYRLLMEEDSAAAGFFRRIPVLCDELRQWLDEYRHHGSEEEGFWEGIRLSCATRVERVSRLKRSSCGAHQPIPSLNPAKNPTGTVHGSNGGQQQVTANANTCHPPTMVSRGDGRMAPTHGSVRGVAEACWNVPVLHNATADEYRLLGLGLGLPGAYIQHIQRSVQMFSLPGNLKRLQMERLEAAGPEGQRAAYLQSRWYICTHCMITNQKTQHHSTRLRLDTLSQRLVCATCLSPDSVVAVNMLGRIMVLYKTHYYLCPQCTLVHAYVGGGEQPWVPADLASDGGRGCCHDSQHQGRARGQQLTGTSGGNSSTQSGKGSKRKERCCVCSEHALIPTARRVDHLTGEMTEFHYCQRHMPRTETARKCVNSRQLMRSVRSPHKGRGQPQQRQGTTLKFPDY